MTKQECAIIMAYTGICMLTGEEFNEFHKYIEYIMNRPVWTHELADKKIWEEIKEKSEDDFMNLCKEAITDGWVKCEDRLPEDRQIVLVYFELEDEGKITGIYDALPGAIIKLYKSESEKIKMIAWQPFPRYEGEIQPEEELPFK